MEISIRKKPQEINWDELRQRREMEHMSIEHRISKFQSAYMNYFLKKKNTLKLQTTTGYFYVLRLHKKRLNLLGMKVKPEFLTPWNGLCTRDIDSLTDQKYSLAVATKSIWLKKTYLKEGISLYEAYQEDTARYTLARAKRENKYFCCPHCGQKNIRTFGYDEVPCSHCHVLIYPEDLDQKVASFGVEHTKEVEKQVQDEVVDWLAEITGIAAGTIGFFEGLFTALPNNTTAKSLLFGILAFGLWNRSVFLLVLLIKALLRLGYTIIHYLKRYLLKEYKIKQPREFEEEVQQFDSYFSVDLFLGCLENVLLAIHFAQSPKEYELFLFDDVKIPKNYQNVVDCFVEKTEFLNFTFDETYQTIQARVQMKLLILEEEKVKEKHEFVEVIMNRNKNSEQVGQIYLGAYCPNCGAKLLMERGKNCSECGKICKESESGWLLANYQIL